MGREVCCAAPEIPPDQVVLMTEGRSSNPLASSGSSSSVLEPEEAGVAAIDALSVLEAAGAAPAAPSQRADTPPLLNPQMPPAFFTMDALHEAAERYLDEFARFDFMRKFLDGHDGAWEQANLVMAIILGFKYVGVVGARCLVLWICVDFGSTPKPTNQPMHSFDEWGNVDASGLHARFRHLPYPPDFQGNPELSALLEAILAEDEDEDKQKGLEEFLEVRGLCLCGGLGCGGGEFIDLVAQHTSPYPPNNGMVRHR